MTKACFENYWTELPVPLLGSGMADRVEFEPFTEFSFPVLLAFCWLRCGKCLLLRYVDDITRSFHFDGFTDQVITTFVFGVSKRSGTKSVNQRGRVDGDAREIERSYAKDRSKEGLVEGGGRKLVVWVRWRGGRHRRNHCP